MRIRGSLERKDAAVIQGWLTVEADHQHQSLEIIVDGETIGLVEAKELRADVREAGFGDGACGFSYRLPTTLDPARAASARIRLLATEIYLSKGDEAGSGAAESVEPIGAGGVFILGAARSGTSITLVALKTVLRLPGLGEGHVLPIFQRMIHMYYLHVMKFVSQTGVLANGLDVDDLRDAMIGFIRRFYFDRFQGGRFIDKTPGLEALFGAPFVRQVFPGAKIIVMTRNGVEVVESYRKKFRASFADACREWADCARQIEILRETMPDILFLDQNEMRATPDIAARKLAAHVEQPEKADELADFLRRRRVDVLSEPDAWDDPPTLESVGWTEEEREIYQQHKVTALGPQILQKTQCLSGDKLGDLNRL